MKTFGKILLLIFLCVYAVELTLRFADPIGTMAYARNVHWTRTTRQPAPSGYTHAPGAYRVNGQPITIGDNGLRITPSGDNACTVAALGDSVAFGLGVSDTDVFVWQLAERFPSVQWVNTARTGYNAGNLSRVLDEYAPNGWLYHAVSNDAGTPTDATNAGRLPLAITLHWRIVTGIRTERVATSPPDWRAFDALMTRLQARNALMVGAAGHAVTARLTGLKAGHSIPAHHHPISMIDPHPNAAGHTHIANALTPLVADWLPTVCDD